MSRFDPTIGIRADEVLSLVEDVRSQFAARAEEAAQISSTSTQGTVVDGTFTPVYTAGKRNRFVYVTLRFADFGAAYDLKIVIVARAEIVDADTYNDNRYHAKIADQIDDNGRAAQLYTTRIDLKLDWNTEYDIIRLITIGQDENDKVFNPDDLDYSGYPGNVLYTFTTPLEPGVGQAGGTNLIVGGGMLNSLDQFSVLLLGTPPSVPDQKYLGRRWETDANSGTRIDNLLTGLSGSLDTAGVSWLDSNGMMLCKSDMFSLGGKPANRLPTKRMVGGETYTFSCLTAADGPDSSQMLEVALYDQGTPGDMVLNTPSSNWEFSTLPDWKILVAILRIPDSYVMSGRQWITLRITGDIGVNWYTTKWKLEYGENISPWVPHQGDEDQLDAQTNITPQGQGNVAQTTGGIFDITGRKYGGDGDLIGEYRYA